MHSQSPSLYWLSLFLPLLADPVLGSGLGRPYRCVRAKAPIVLDGKLDEWAAIPKMRVDASSCGPVKPASDDDLSYVAWLAWDEANLYVAADVTDDTLLFPTAGNTMWRCDSFSICLELGNYGNAAGGVDKDDEDWVDKDTTPQRGQDD
jgi:hypothetical protein